MSQMLCLNCFNIKGGYEVCPVCGYVEGGPQKELFQLKPGTILQDRYIIGEAIGYGGFGITYKAYDSVLSIVVAIKEFYPAGLVSRAEGEVQVSIFSGEKAEQYKKLRNRFVEEARNMALFAKEKDIINVFTYFEENETAYIIMEYVDRPILKEVLKQRGKFTEEAACKYLCAVLVAIQKIHSRGIIHKDISPDNIFVLDEERVKLFDFGAARFQGGENEKHLSVVVKAGYAPPEQYRSKGQQDIRMDIYAAGAVLYQMLTGHRPMEALERGIQDQMLPPSKMGCTVQPHVERALMKALSLKADDRFSSADEFREALMTPDKKKGWRWW